MLIALDDIQENGNMRRTSHCATADAALEASIAALGVLQPILVRPDPNGGYVLIAGYRRVAAARRVGLAEVPAEIRLMGKLESEAAQAAENVVRLPVDPVDLWRHIDQLIQAGYSLQSAGASLGMPDRHIQQISILSQIAPRLLDAMAGKQLPPWRTLGIIAQAPHDQQIAAFERHNYPHGVTWTSVSAECTAHRIPQDRAIFDVAESGVHFDEDLFAEPGSPEQFTTGDIAGFMAAQLAAVQDRIQNGDEPAMLLEYSPMAQLPKLPTGWVYVERKEPLTPRSKHKRAYAIVPANDWMDAGRVVDVVIKPATTTKATTAPATTHSTDATEPEEHEPALPAAEPEALPDDACPLTKAGYDLLAAIRNEALHDALRSPLRMAPEKAGTALLMAYAAGRYDLREILAAIVSPEGTITIPDANTFAAMVGEALARTINLTPLHRQNQVSHSAESYHAGEWIGAIVNADGLMPPVDTPEFLSCVGGRTLQNLAHDHLPKPETAEMPAKVADLRRWLCGRIPSWVPVHFGAPGPIADAWKNPRDGNGDPECPDTRSH